MAGKNSDNIRCSFCNKTQSQVKKMIAGPAGVYICDECVSICSDIVEEEYEEAEAENEPEMEINLLKPVEIKEFLDDYVIGQEEAKKVLAVSVYNHYKRVMAPKDLDDVELQKSNIIMMGPTGSGKTYLAQTLAKIINVPFAIADATTLTEAGYVGEDVENILLKLIQAADYDVERAQLGIIYIDEIDKITKKSENVSITRDVSGEGVQQALLKVIESGKVSITPDSMKGMPKQEFIQIDTTNILFICTGSFTDIKEMVQRRIDTGTMGFNSEILTKTEAGNELMKQIETDDLMKYGLIPEFIGRIPVIVVLDDLDEDSMLEILWKPNNSLLSQYEQLFSLEDVKLTVTQEAQKAIVKIAMKRKSGARALRAVMEDVMLDIMYEIPSMENVKEVVIDENVVLNKEPPRIIYHTENESAS